MTDPTPVPPAHWERAFPLADLAVGSARVVRHPLRRIAVFRLSEHELRAVDDACPHEGYPLVGGIVRDRVLTCAWHHFKFDLRDGTCLVGEEDVRTWPVRVFDGEVELDLARAAAGASPVDSEALRESLAAGLFEASLGRVARDTARLLAEGEPAARIALCAARFDARRAEYGTQHALPLATDVLRYARWRDGLELTLPLLAALDMAADGCVRRPERPRPEPSRDLGGVEDEPAAVSRRLARLVEIEDAAGAEALARWAVRRGWRPELVPLLTEALAAHHLDFGHPVIYTAKLAELLADDGPAAEHLDPDTLEDLVGALAFRIVHAMREDTLPPWRTFGKRLDALTPELAELARRPAAPGTWSPDALHAALIGGSGRAVFDELVAALRGGVPSDTLLGVVSAAAAERLLRFDVAHDGDPTVQDGWLSVTHTLTHAAAVRVLLRAAASGGRGRQRAGPAAAVLRRSLRPRRAQAGRGRLARGLWSEHRTAEPCAGRGRGRTE